MKDTQSSNIQLYVASPQGNMSGWYIVEKWDFIIKQYTPLKGEEYPTLEQAKERAHELNEAAKADANIKLN